MKFHPFLYSTLCLGVLSVSAAAASAALPRTWSVAAGAGAGAGRDPNCPFAPAHLPAALPAPAPAALRAALDSLGAGLDSAINNVSLPSAVVSVAYRGASIYTHGAGEIKKGTGRAPDAHTRYRIGSVTKVFPVLQLYQRAREPESGVGLDDPLAAHGHKIFFRNEFPPGGRQPSLRELASQRGGLPREAPCANVLMCGNVTSAEMAAKINASDATTLIHPPGAPLPSYSNLAFALLGRELVPDVATATTWEGWTQTHILDALNLTRTGFGLDWPTLDSNTATGYEPDGKSTGDYHLGWTAPAGGMHSTTHDLNMLADAIMTGRAFGGDTVAANEMMSPVFLNPGGTTLFGTPWEMRFHNATGFLVRRKGGNVPGFTALLAFVPELRLSVSALFSGQADEFGASQKIFDTLLPPLVDALQAMGTDAPRQPKDPASFVGNFTARGYPKGSPGSGARILVHDGSLVLVVEALGVGLYLRVPDWAAATEEVAGTVMMQWWGQREKMPCLTGELSAYSGQYVIFEEDLSSFSIPGLLGDRFVLERDA